jgi:hypothetical protein
VINIYLREGENSFLKLFLVAVGKTNVVKDVCFVRMEWFTCDSCLQGLNTFFELFKAIISQT